MAKYWRSPAVVMLTSHKTRSWRHRSAMRPVSEKSLVLAFVLFSSAAVNDSKHPSKAELGTFIPASTTSSSRFLAGGFLARVFRRDSTCMRAASTSVGARKHVFG
jgi:hypothetical protein